MEYEIKIFELQNIIQRFGIKCQECGRGWFVGDRERTKEEKQDWLCPDCEKEEAFKDFNDGIDPEEDY